MAEPILRQLILHRFRSLQMEQIEFDNPTFLVGQNGSGKSNFADSRSSQRQWSPRCEPLLSNVEDFPRLPIKTPQRTVCQTWVCR